MGFEVSIGFPGDFPGGGEGLVWGPGGDMGLGEGCFCCGLCFRSLIL